MLSATQTPELFDERTADKQVIESLLKELGRKNMTGLVQTANGDLLQVHKFEELTLETAAEIAEKLQADLTLVQNWMASKQAELNGDQATPKAAAPATPAEPEAPTAPADNPPAQPEAPVDAAPAADASADPAAPAEPAADTSTETPAATDTAPADQPVAPVDAQIAAANAPAADPAAEQPPLQ